MKKTTHFVISRDAHKGYRWKLIGANGETVATGESYKTRRALTHAMKHLREWAATDRIEELKKKTPAPKKK
jgi:uncharacterized protein YegP (UPF0339 family)